VIFLLSPRVSPRASSQEMSLVAVDRDESVIRCCALEAELQSVILASERAAVALAKLQQENGEQVRSCFHSHTIVSLTAL